MSEQCRRLFRDKFNKNIKVFAVIGFVFMFYLDKKRSFLERADGVNIPCEDLVRGGACCKEALLKFLGTAVAHFPSRNTHSQAEM